VKIKGKPTVILQVEVTLNESEAGALLELGAYGTDEFLKMFYLHLGESCLKPYEDGIRSLFESAKHEIPLLLNQARKARESFYIVEGDTNKKEQK